MTGIMMNPAVVVAKEQMSCAVDDETGYSFIEERSMLFIESLWELDMIPDPEAGQDCGDTGYPPRRNDIDKETCEADLLSFLNFTIYSSTQGKIMSFGLVRIPAIWSVEV